MSVLIFAESHAGSLKKNTQETLYYGAKIASQLNTTAVALLLGDCSAETAALAGKLGISKILSVSSVHHFDPQLFTKIADAAVTSSSSDVVVFTHDKVGKAVAPRLSARLRAGLVSGAVDFPAMSGVFSVKKNVFSGKAVAEYQINTAKKILTLLPNSVQVQQSDAPSAEIVDFNSSTQGYQSPLSIEVKKVSNDGEVNLTDAEIVVSAGRGLKGPENWGVIEDLAKILGAATACSRPVADIGWRPHHEHVGQTGIAIRPNLYIAVGISGAIQHLAGVNGSKVIVVINKDPEAPFFKAADYGIVGDAFEIMPKLNAAFKKFKEQNV